MHLDDFAARLRQLEDPYTDVQTRHAADQWLTQLRDSPHAWSTAQAALSAGDPSLWPHAAHILAYKSKRQLAQIEAIDQRMKLLQKLSTTLATLSSSSHMPATHPTSSSSSSFRAVTQGLCIAISNLIIQLPTLPRPLESMGSLLDEHVMLDFLTILPGECDDAYSALQTSMATDASEAAFLLKQRAGEWCGEVGSWLYNLLNSMVQSHPQLAAYLTSTGGSPLINMQPNTTTTAAAMFPPLFVPSISCFSAWIKWGGLFYMAQEHWEYMLRLSSTVLISTGTDASIHYGGSMGVSAVSAAVVAGVEALSEAIERPAPKTQRVLLEICLRIAQYITIVFPLGNTNNNMTNSSTDSICSDHYRHVTHVLTTYCSTNASVVASEATEGGVLRNVLLHLVALSGERAATSAAHNDDNAEEDEEEGTGGAPAVDALGDVLEAIVDPSLSIRDAIETETAMGIDNGGNNNDGDDDFFSNIRLISDRERINFASTALSVLLQYSQVPLPHLLGSTPATTIALALPSRLRNFRTQAEWLLWLCGEILEATTFTQHIYSFFQTASTGASRQSALQALEVCFYAIHKGAGGAFSEDRAIDFSKPTPPPWLGPLLSLYATARELDPCQRQQLQQQQTAPTTPGVNTFHFNLLSSFATVAPPLMKALASMPDQCQGLIDLVFTQARAAITAATAAPKISRTINSENFLGSSEEYQTGDMENESVEEAAAQAVRAVLSSPAEVQALALAAGAVGAIDSMLAALTITSGTSITSSSPNTVLYRRRDSAATKSSQQLIIALVRVLHTQDQHAAAAAQQVLRNRTLQPLVTHAATTAAAAVAATPMHFNVLHAFLEDLMALLNALESHLDLTLGSYSEHSGPVVNAAVNDAVTACLAAWPDIMTALSQAATGSSAIPSSSIVNFSSIIYHDASQCLCSCIHLSPTSITPSLTPLLESMYSTFFLPGGHSMHRILCALLESTILNYNQISTLVTATGTTLTHPMAQKYYSLSAGDADPDAACALMTLATCLLRQASSNSQWKIVLTNSRNTSPPLASNASHATVTTSHQEPLCSGIVAPLIQCVNLALRLAASNTACNHRGVCQRAIATLTAALVLILDTSCTALHGPLLQLFCSTSAPESTGSNAVILDSTSNTLSSGGVVIMQGILLCLLSLYSLSFLPKIVNLMTDAAKLAIACCQNQGASDQRAAVTQASVSLLQKWWNTARMNLEREGAVAAAVQEASSSLNSLNWEPLVAAAAAAGAGRNKNYGRDVRQLANQIKKNHSSGI